jgi:hypothetical protein
MTAWPAKSPTPRSHGAENSCITQELAGEAAGLLISPAAGLASIEAAGLASSPADAEASGAEVSSDLLQAMLVAAKNIEIRPKTRILRITSSFVQPAQAAHTRFGNGATIL